MFDSYMHVPLVNKDIPTSFIAEKASLPPAVTIPTWNLLHYGVTEAKLFRVFQFFNCFTWLAGSPDCIGDAYSRFLLRAS